ncbi:hypothetical protein ARAF_0803 [Arsenophonus endosymbiont of Aleurodicus floccissimus]|nr:hypothetical protein ARAF_0803 [Arsenophonus endosymbiont of Aleurodicus floccissimus]
MVPVNRGNVLEQRIINEIHWFTQSHSIMLIPVKAQTNENGNAKTEKKGKEKQETEKEITDEPEKQITTHDPTISQ